MTCVYLGVWELTIRSGGGILCLGVWQLIVWCLCLGVWQRIVAVSVFGGVATDSLVWQLIVRGMPRWRPRPPQKFRKSHWCVPFTATFSKRRKIGALWSERCDALEWWSLKSCSDAACLLVSWKSDGLESNKSNINLIISVRMLPQRVCCAWPSAMPVQHARVPEQAQGNTFPSKN